MNEKQQQQALNLLAEANQRLSNHCLDGLSKYTARLLIGRINKFMHDVEETTGMTNIQEINHE